MLLVVYGVAALAVVAVWRIERPSKHEGTVRTATQGWLTYHFSRPVSPQRAFNEFVQARDKQLPNGSVIEISRPSGR
jgi:hypothetical protein